MKVFTTSHCSRGEVVTTGPEGLSTGRGFITVTAGNALPRPPPSVILDKTDPGLRGTDAVLRKSGVPGVAETNERPTASMDRESNGFSVSTSHVASPTLRQKEPGQQTSEPETSMNSIRDGKPNTSEASQKEKNKDHTI